MTNAKPITIDFGKHTITSDADGNSAAALGAAILAIAWEGLRDGFLFAAFHNGLRQSLDDCTYCRDEAPATDQTDDPSRAA